MATYATLAECKGYLRIPTAETSDDTLITLALDAATEAIDLACDTTDSQFTPVPAMIKQACLIQTSRWFMRRDAPFGVLGSTEFGNYTRLQAALDPDVQLMLGGHGQRLRWGTTV